jgi:hypothetical protein
VLEIKFHVILGLLKISPSEGLVKYLPVYQLISAALSWAISSLQESLEKFYNY